MKRILMVGTGGTIAAEMTEAGLAPGLGGKDLLTYVPALRDLCEVDCVQVFSLDSTNMTPDHWLTVAGAIRERYGDYDGFVVCHGTDTMAYTAAALSYLIQDSPKPIVLTGGQKPIYTDTTDSKTNLLDAFTVACDGRIPGVTIVFGGAVILGTRARKTYSKSFGAFSSINYPALGVVRDGQLIPYLCPTVGDKPRFFDALDSSVSLLKLIPGASPAQLSFLLEESHAVIIESFGVGGVPAGDGGEFYRIIRDNLAAGKIIAVTTQVQNEGSDLAVYSVGHRLKSELGVLEAYDMTTEALTAKLMWALARTTDPAALSKLLYTPIANDILCYPE
ncbi:MAG: asparaginase [Oscillospiraceae bacterium]|nr:asparaginase [Oscillospiraceae bacterium]